MKNCIWETYFFFVIISFFSFPFRWRYRENERVVKMRTVSKMNGAGGAGASAVGGMDLPGGGGGGEVGVGEGEEEEEEEEPEEYTINLHPDIDTLGRAYIELIETYGWDNVVLLYQNTDSIPWLKPIFDRTSEVRGRVGRGGVVAKRHFKLGVFFLGGPQLHLGVCWPPDSTGILVWPKLHLEFGPNLTWNVAQTSLGVWSRLHLGFGPNFGNLLYRNWPFFSANLGQISWKKFADKNVNKMANFALTVPGSAASQPGFFIVPPSTPPPKKNTTIWHILVPFCALEILGIPSCSVPDFLPRLMQTLSPRFPKRFGNS